MRIEEIQRREDEARLKGEEERKELEYCLTKGAGVKKPMSEVKQTTAITKTTIQPKDEGDGDEDQDDRNKVTEKQIALIKQQTQHRSDDIDRQHLMSTERLKAIEVEVEKSLILKKRNRLKLKQRNF